VLAVVGQPRRQPAMQLLEGRWPVIFVAEQQADLF
jgi:hypothetical protein